MKKEAVSVLKPHNGKTFKSKVDNKKPKKNSPKIEKRVAATEPRGKPTAKIVNVQQVDFGEALRKLKNQKNIKSKVADQPKIVNIEKINGIDGKTTKTGSHKMAAVSKEVNETRVQPKKKLKTETEASIVPVKKQKKIAKVESQQKTSKIEVVAATKPKTKRKSEVMSRKSIENVGDLKMTKTHVLESIQAVRQLAQKKQETKKSLLPAENNPLLLQVECIRIAKTPRRQIRPFLPHQLAGPLDDVALFVPDLKRGRGRDYENTVDHWETILREKGVDCIKEIIPMNRVKTEFRQYEMQRKLAMSFDYFLADARISGHLTHLLGKNFFHRRSAPTPLKLGRDNLKSEMNFALHKTCMEIHSYGNTHTMPVGTFSMEAEKLAENVWAACEKLKVEYPGGWENIRSIRLKTSTGPAIPIYISLVSKNDVPIPVVKPKRPRAYETVEGELTTVPGGAHVKLTPEGRIYVNRLKDYGDPEIKEEEDDDDDDEDEEEIKIKQESEVENENSDDDDDEQ